MKACPARVGQLTLEPLERDAHAVKFTSRTTRAAAQKSQSSKPLRRRLWRSSIEDLSPHASPCRYLAPAWWAAMREIVRNVGQAATGTTEVTSNIAGVAQASEETGAAAS